MTDNLRTLLAAATPGPWRADGIGVEGYPLVSLEAHKEPGTFSDPDAALIVAAVNALPLMLDVIEAARAVIARVPHGMATETEVGLDLALARLDALEANHG